MDIPPNRLAGVGNIRLVIPVRGREERRSDGPSFCAVGLSCDGLPNWRGGVHLVAGGLATVMVALPRLTGSGDQGAGAGITVRAERSLPVAPAS